MKARANAGKRQSEIRGRNNPLWFHRCLPKALKKHATPFYLFSTAAITSALDELSVLETNLPIRHWYSFKTAPVAALLRYCKQMGVGVEVVSDYELQAALSEGFAPEKILVNGVSKHSWLFRHRVRGLTVHFDSLHEVRNLIGQTVRDGWRIGLRIHICAEPASASFELSTQFGLSEGEAVQAVKILASKNVRVQGFHFHLRKNVASPHEYGAAIDRVSKIARKLKVEPHFIDCGGGLPVEGEWPFQQRRKSPPFDLLGLRDILRGIKRKLPSVREIWMENGRFLFARSAVLVIKVIDVKDRADCRFLICDGGRTNQALGAGGDIHRSQVYPARPGRNVWSAICGPNCMISDRLMTARLPKSIQRGDYIIWMNAGAYHIPFETRFSHGLAKVLLCEKSGRIKVAREREDFSRFWEHWSKPSDRLP